MADLITRFWAKVDMRGPDECWEWTGARTSLGYGRFSIGAKRCRSHRVAWELENGSIPDGMCVLHHCDNRRCVNARAHLFIGTQMDNLRDMTEKGRRAPMPDTRGEKSGKAKLTESDVREIREATGTHNAIAKRFGVSRQAVGSIRSGMTWAVA